MATVTLHHNKHEWSEASGTGRVDVEIFAVLMCGFGWIVPQISWTAIFWIWVYLLVWLVILGAVRVAMERAIDNRLAHRERLSEIVNAPLHHHRGLHRK